MPAVPKFGIKRSCTNCDTHFYDLNKQPPICPKCNHTYQPPAIKMVSHRKRRAVSDRFMADEELSRPIAGKAKQRKEVDFDESNAVEEDAFNE